MADLPVTTELPSGANCQAELCQNGIKFQGAKLSEYLITDEMINLEDYR